MTADTPPRPIAMPDGRASIHGTAIAHRGRGLLILGAAGTGKSGLAAEMIVFGARLVSDDLVVLCRRDDRLWAVPPEGRVPGLELRGLFPVRPPSVEEAPLAAILFLAPSRARLPDPDRFDALGAHVPLWRHPAAPGLAAKAILALATPPF